MWKYQFYGSAQEIYGSFFRFKLIKRLKKPCMQRLRVAYNCGCRALYNLPWRTSVSCHQVQCNIPTYAYVLWCSQIVCIPSYSSNTAIAFYFVTEWVLEHCSVCLIDGVSCHNAFAFYLNSAGLGIGVLLCSSVAAKRYVLTNFSVKNVSVTLWFCLQRNCKMCL